MRLHAIPNEEAAIKLTTLQKNVIIGFVTFYNNLHPIRLRRTSKGCDILWWNTYTKAWELFEVSIYEEWAKKKLSTAEPFTLERYVTGGIE